MRLFTTHYLLALVLLIFSAGSYAEESKGFCSSTDGEININISCAIYNNQAYEANLLFDKDLNKEKGLFTWSLDSAVEIFDVEDDDNNCVKVDSNLNLDFPCVIHKNNRYFAKLNFKNNLTKWEFKELRDPVTSLFAIETNDPSTPFILLDDKSNLYVFLNENKNDEVDQFIFITAEGEQAYLKTNSDGLPVLLSNGNTNIYFDFDLKVDEVQVFIFQNGEYLYHSEKTPLSETLVAKRRQRKIDSSSRLSTPTTLDEVQESMKEIRKGWSDVSTVLAVIQPLYNPNIKNKLQHIKATTESLLTASIKNDTKAINEVSLGSWRAEYIDFMTDTTLCIKIASKGSCVSAALAGLDVIIQDINLANKLIEAGGTELLTEVLLETVGLDKLMKLVSDVNDSISDTIEKIDLDCTSDESLSCPISNGSGTEIRYCSTEGSWNGYSDCEISSCDSGYIQEGNSCVEEPTVCNSGDTQAESCAIANGLGFEARSCSADGSSWGEYGSCELSHCNTGYIQEGNSCVPEPKECNSGETDSVICTVENAVGFETRSCSTDGEWGEFGSCDLTHCKPGYYKSGDSCVKEEVKECTSDVLSTCPISNGLGTRTRFCSAEGNWNGYSECEISECNYGHRLEEDNCMPTVRCSLMLNSINSDDKGIRCDSFLNLIITEKQCTDLTNDTNLCVYERR